MTIDSELIPEPPASIAGRIRFYRQAADLTIGEFASRCGIASCWLADMEAGRWEPSEVMLHKMAESLRVPVSELRGQGTPIDDILKR